MLLLPGCGNSSKGDPIPANQADALVRAIQAADQYNADGRCQRAHTKVRDARFLLSRVPQGVDSDVRQGIGDGLDHLDSLINSECEQKQPTQPETTPTETQTTQTETTPTDTTPTETTPTETQPTQTTLTTTTPTTTAPTQTDTGPATGNGGTPPGQANGANGADGATGGTP